MSLKNFGYIESFPSATDELTMLSFHFFRISKNYSAEIKPHTNMVSGFGPMSLIMIPEAYKSGLYSLYAFIPFHSRLDRTSYLGRDLCKGILLVRIVFCIRRAVFMVLKLWGNILLIGFSVSTGIIVLSKMS